MSVTPRWKLTASSIGMSASMSLQRRHNLCLLRILEDADLGVVRAENVEGHEVPGEGHHRVEALLLQRAGHVDAEHHVLLRLAEGLFRALHHVALLLLEALLALLRGAEALPLRR